LYSSANFMMMRKSKGRKWAEGKGKAYGVFAWKTKCKRPLRRHRVKWKNDSEVRIKHLYGKFGLYLSG